ncbi:MAG: DUF2752 domain-containing protein [Saprospiraceae bacterium]
MSTKKGQKPFPKWVQKAWLTALVAAPILLWILPADYFDEGQSICPSVLLFDTECFGCGTTRAVQHLHHFEFGDAIYFHSLSPLIYAFLLYLWGSWTYHTAARLGVFGSTRAERVEASLKEEATRSEKDTEA